MLTNMEFMPTSLTEELRIAIQCNDSKSVENMIHSGTMVNCRDADGNTPLHLAIMAEADFKLLKVLMENGACSTLKNKNGDCALKCVKRGSIQTIESVLKLEKHYSFEDGLGNTCMHTLMTMHQNGDIPHRDGFWEMISTNKDYMNIDFNTRNYRGVTALMLAAEETPDPRAYKSLRYILNNVDNLDVFVTDDGGDTFLHKYLFSAKIADDMEFFTSLFHGKFSSCPKHCIKKLLLCQNKEGDTPFLIFLNNTSNKIDIDILELFIEAGVEVNMCNAREESVLHRIIRNMSEVLDEKEDENIKYLVKRGADVNARDICGELPITSTYEINSVRALLDMNADVNRPNKFGQTPLFQHLCVPYKEFNIIEILLEKGANVNAVDQHGSSVLHYIAWEGTSIDVLPLLLEYNVKIVSDELGQLPCHVAYFCRNKEAFDALCKCGRNAHADLDNFCFQKEEIKSDQIREITDKGVPKQVEKIASRFRKFRESIKSKILNLPDIGKLSFQEEEIMIKTVVNELVRNICKEIGNRDNLFVNVLLESGSFGEGTKVGSPEEFDFVCILTEFSRICEIDTDKTSQGEGFAYLTLKQDFRDHRSREFFNEEGYLDTYKVWTRCQSMIGDIFRTCNLLNHPNVQPCQDTVAEFDVHQPTCNFSIWWSGKFYKNIQIDIDLVLACQIKEWWPQNATIDYLPKEITESVQREGALLIFQSQLSILEPYPSSNLRISALNAERKYMKSLPALPVDAYILSKVLCDNRICPSVGVHGFESQDCKQFLTSYSLKNCMFKVWQLYKHTKNRDADERDMYSEAELHEFVSQIFQALLFHITEENLPNFMFPDQNIFTFKSRVIDEDENHVKCSFRKIFAKVILSLLGHSQDFSDIDIECLSEYQGGAKLESDYTELTDSD